ncbi:uncharacterized protein K444DRAFT_515584, partial [Hyaloscypha bicolor E]
RKLWAARINDLFCPDFETWGVRREESDLTDWEAQEMADLESCGIRGWMGLANPRAEVLNEGCKGRN